MVVVVFSALAGAVVANFGAQLGVLGRPFTIGRHKFNTGVTGVDTLHAAVGTIVGAFFGGHLHQAVLAINQTLLAGFDTFLISRVHNLNFMCLEFNAVFRKSGG